MMKERCAALYQKTGGFIQGICHPKTDSARLRDVGLHWVRRDLPYPFDEEGNFSTGYQEFKKRCQADADLGLSSIVVTPYPKHFIRHGIDIRTQEGLAEMARVCALIARDFSDLHICWQATNEMHIVHFRAPLNAVQAKDFLIACIRGLQQGNPSAAVGHNSVDYEWAALCAEIEEKAPCDYVGLDCYDGTWSEGGVDSYREKIDLVYERLHKPVILMEFGFSSLGGNEGFGQREVDAYIQSLGFTGLQNALAHPVRLLAALPPVLAQIADKVAPEDLEKCILSFFPHLLKKWHPAGQIPHTEAGQAQFYDQILPMLQAHPAVGGAVIYCWRDSERCFLCGENDCPCETAWGLTRIDGSEKPALDTVRRVFGSPINSQK